MKTGGSGTAEDAKLVAESLAKLPKSTLEQMQKNGTKVIACRGSVTDYRTDLRGVQPRGGPPGATWDKVPQADLYGGKPQLQGSLQPGVEVHITDKVSAVGQVSIPFATSGAPNPPPSAGVGIKVVAF